MSDHQGANYRSKKKRGKPCYTGIFAWGRSLKKRTEREKDWGNVRLNTLHFSQSSSVS
jgi:hypothetical protein